MKSFRERLMGRWLKKCGFGAICGLATALSPNLGVAQVPGTVPTNDPGLGSVYAPQGTDAAFNSPYPSGFAPNDMMLPNMNGMQQPGELNSLNYSQNLGDYGNLSLYGSPNPESAGAGAAYSVRPTTFAHVRDLQFGVFANNEQTVINAGTTFELFVNDRVGAAGRVLLGNVQNENYRDSFHFTGDVYMGSTLDGEHWIKGGVLWDSQDNFHKLGPAVGGLFFADRKHPLSLDVAYGIGYGDPVINIPNRTILAVADDDVQLRAGTYLTPNLQVGFTGNWLNWADGLFEDYNGYGGFVNWNFGTTSVTADFTNGDGRSRGFVHVAYTFGGRRPRPQFNGIPAVVEHPRDWLTKPVIRDSALQLQEVQVANAAQLPGVIPGVTPGVPVDPTTPTTGTPTPTPVPPTTPNPNVPGLVGNLTQVNCRVSFGFNQGLFNPDVNGNGIVDPNENFQIDIQIVNGSTVNANNITFAAQQTVTGAANANTLAGTQTVAVLLPNQQTNAIVQTIFVQPQAIDGNQIFYDFNVTSDNVTRRFRCGPFIVGQQMNEGAFTAATPLN